MTDRLLAWLEGPRRLNELQAIEEAIHASFEALPAEDGPVDLILREAAQEALMLFLEVVELGYDQADPAVAYERLAEAHAAMGRYDALVEQVRQQLSVPLERGTG